MLSFLRYLHRGGCCCSVPQACPLWPFVTPWTAVHQASLSSPSPGACSNPFPLSQWYHPTISPSVIPFSCLLSFPASGSFPVNQFFPSGGQSIRVSASAPVFPMNIQDWFPLGWTGWISLSSKGHSRVFSSTTVQKHQLFSAQLSLWFNSHMHTWLLEKQWLWRMDLCWQSNVSAFQHAEPEMTPNSQRISEK